MALSRAIRLVCQAPLEFCRLILQGAEMTGIRFTEQLNAGYAVDVEHQRQQQAHIPRSALQRAVSKVASLRKLANSASENPAVTEARRRMSTFVASLL